MSERPPETGFSSAEIERAMQDQGWASILPMLRAGGELRRERTGRYYVNGHGSLTAARVRKLEKSGLLRRVGADVYKLAEVIDA